MQHLLSVRFSSLWGPTQELQLQISDHLLAKASGPNQTPEDPRSPNRGSSSLCGARHRQLLSRFFGVPPCLSAAELLFDVRGYGKVLCVGELECDPAAQRDTELFGVPCVDGVMIQRDADVDRDARAAGACARLPSLNHAPCLPQTRNGNRIRPRLLRRVCSVVSPMTVIGAGSDVIRTSVLEVFSVLQRGLLRCRHALGCLGVNTYMC